MPAAWSPFRRRDSSEVVRMVREIASSGDAGAFGHGVEVVIESPHHHWWRRIVDRAVRDQARIAVTGPGGTAGYPIHVRLVTGYGGRAVGKVDRRDHWATSVTSMVLDRTGDRAAGRLAVAPHPHEQGEAILMLKRGTEAEFEPDDAASEVVAGTVAALADLHPFSRDRGWRARIDRDVQRT
jgi:hypothetical protein